MILELTKSLEQRLSMLRTERESWWTHWREIAEYIVPRRYRWLMTPSEATRGAQINQKIIDSTGTIALRVLASGMMSGITSPTRPWFKLTVEGVDGDDQYSPATLWLDEVQKRMMRVFADSNFYNCIAMMYVDLGAFGTAPMLIYEDFKDVIRCYNPCAGEYFAATSALYEVDTLMREFPMTLSQMAEEFGKENLSDNAQTLLASGSPNSDKQLMVGHFVGPNLAPYTVPKSFAYKNVYWELGRGSDRLLRKQGFHELPFVAPRWDVNGNDPYGRSPAMDALGDIKQLQQETKRKAQAIDKMTNPPMLADVQLKNQPASVLPGGVTYVHNLAQKGTGMKPVYQVSPPVRELMEDIREIQQRIKVVFFNDLFMMFQEMQAEPRSAAAVDARREEKLIQLGPVLERLHHEALDPIIERVFGIMSRGRLLPPAPVEIQRRAIKVDYISVLAEAQQAAATAAIERVFAFAGSAAGVVAEEAMDVVNVQEGLQEYALRLGAPAKIIRSDIEVKARQEARAKQAQAAQALNESVGLSQGAKNLSQADVGGGLNALQAMTGASP